MQSERMQIMNTQETLKNSEFQQPIFVPVEFVAARYSVSTATIWRWAKSGNLPRPVILSKGCSRWRLSDLDAFDAARAAA